MQLKKIITCFCFLVLMCQLLPVRQLGSMLFGNQLTEELPHDDDSNLKDSKDKFAFKKDFIFSNNESSLSFIQTVISQYIHFSTALPSLLAGDVQTPPPNAA